MNKRNFFKGLAALLAMPSSIYAKVCGARRTYVNEIFLRQASVRRLEDIKVGMLIGWDGDLFEIIEKPVGEFVHNGKEISNFMGNKFFGRNLFNGCVLLFCLDFPIGPELTLYERA